MTNPDQQLKLRIPFDLKARLSEAANANNRSMNAEIIDILELALSRERKPWDDRPLRFYDSLMELVKLRFEEKGQNDMATSLASDPSNRIDMLLIYPADISPDILRERINTFIRHQPRQTSAAP